MTGGQDGTAILAGDADHPGYGRACAQYIANCFHLEVLWARASPPVGSVIQVVMARVVGTVAALESHRITPVIADDAASLGVGAAEHYSVTGRRHGMAVSMVGIRIPVPTVEEACKPVWREQVAVGHDLTHRQSVDNDQDEQSGMLRRT